MAESDGTLGPGFGSEPALGGSALRPVAVALLETAGHLASPPPPSRPSLPLVEGNLAGRWLAPTSWPAAPPEAAELALASRSLVAGRVASQG